MIEISNIRVEGFEPAIEGMRNPINSWDKSDSEFNVYYPDEDLPDDVVWYFRHKVGETDMDLMQRLFKAGTEHRKYLRFIDIWMTVRAPLYWWKEADTYHFMDRNSCSTMHTIASKPFDTSDFSTDHLLIQNKITLQMWIDTLNEARENYLKTKDKMWWWQMIQLLPSSYMQQATLKFNYETAANIIRQRSNHKLDEWHTFCDALKNNCPYITDITGCDLHG